MNILKRFIGMLISVSILGLGIALILKASIGASPYDALSQTVSEISTIKVGTVTIIINSIFIMIQILLKGKNFPIIQYLQFIVIFLLGNVVNIFLYNILNFEISNYLIKSFIYICGTLVSALGIAGIVNINIVYTALEGFLVAITEKTKSNFVKNRLYYDIICVILAIALAFIFKVDLQIREGTIISAFIFAPIMGYFMRITKPLFKKLGILDPAINN